MRAWRNTSFRHTADNYTAVNNEFLLDPELSPTAKAVLAVILTNKDDWVVYPDEIAKRMGISKNTVLRQFKSFEELGYMENSKKWLGRGKGSEVVRKFSDRKIFK